MHQIFTLIVIFILSIFYHNLKNYSSEGTVNLLRSQHPRSEKKDNVHVAPSRNAPRQSRIYAGAP